MRGISDFFRTGRFGQSIRVGLAAVMATAALAPGCSRTPTSPETLRPTDPVSTASAVSGQGGDQTWQEFASRGWNCRTPNNGPVTVCSPPGQPLPVVAFPPAQPPADRPPTVMLKRWRNGVFEANVLLIRPEIYNGQVCESTGLAYTYASVLGYYECAH